MAADDGTVRYRYFLLLIFFFSPFHAVRALQLIFFCFDGGRVRTQSLNISLYFYAVFFSVVVRMHGAIISRQLGTVSVGCVLLFIYYYLPLLLVQPIEMKRNISDMHTRVCLCAHESGGKVVVRVKRHSNHRRRYRGARVCRFTCALYVCACLCRNVAEPLFAAKCKVASPPMP